MAKLTLTDLASLENQTSAISTINANSALIEAALENTLSRDGTGPNSMGADFDVNSNDILNTTTVTGTPDAGELTIVTGAVTATGAYHTVDTEADASTDDLATVNGGVDGMHLILQAEDAARSVVLKDGTGNLQIAGDFTMDNSQDTIFLIYSGALSAWCEICRSNNGA